VETQAFVDEAIQVRQCLQRFPVGDIGGLEFYVELLRLIRVKSQFIEHENQSWCNSITA